MTEDAWFEGLGEALVRVLELSRALPAEPWRIPLTNALAAVSNELGRRPTPAREAILSCLAAATQEALALEAAGLGDGALVRSLAAAWNLGQQRPADAELPRADTASREATLVATRGIPRLLQVRIDAEVMPDEPVAIPAEGAAPREDIEDTRSAIIGDDVPERFDPDAPAPPLVRVGDGGEPRPLRDFYAGILDRGLRKVAMLGRHRTERRMTEWKAEENRILAAIDAVIATGPECVARTLAWWQASLDSPDPWKTWAPCFCLGTVDGPVSYLAIRSGLCALPPTATRHAELAAEALLVSPHPQMSALLAELRTLDSPIARSVAVDLRARSGVASPEELKAHLLDPNAVVALAALRATARVDPSLAALLHPYVLLWMNHDDPAIAFQAARAAILGGRNEPITELRRGGKLRSRLPPLAVLELLILAGEAGDIGIIQQLLSKTKPSAALLSALARLGHVGTWAFLVHFLSEKDFAEAASDALFVLFGDKVPWSDRLNGSEWRDAIASAKLEPGQRLRRGRPWSPAVVADECTSTSALLSRREVEQRVDELSARTGVHSDVDLAHWSPRSAPGLVAYLARVSATARNWLPGVWSRDR